MSDRTGHGPLASTKITKGTKITKNPTMGLMVFVAFLRISNQSD